MTGANGFLGSSLTGTLSEAGYRVVPLVRRQPGRGEIHWDPTTGSIDDEALEGLDAVVHLAGESILGVWTPAKKRRILASRANGTRILAEALARLRNPPRVLVCASGIGYYGDAGDTILTEAHPPGDDFLAHVCLAWEAATEPAENAGIRTVRTRFGLILDPSGGALAKMLPVFRLGLGARLGSGRQWVSWISLTDVLRILHHAIASDGIAGSINATSPEPVRNRDFTDALGQALRRPTLLAIPDFVLRWATAGMAEALLLASQRAVPDALLGRGFEFEIPTIRSLFERTLGGTTEPGKL